MKPETLNMGQFKKLVEKAVSEILQDLAEGLGSDYWKEIKPLEKNIHEKWTEIILRNLL